MEAADTEETPVGSEHKERTTGWMMSVVQHGMAPLWRVSF